jgi:lysophospholipase L1-like esterase
MFGLFACDRNENTFMHAFTIPYASGIVVDGEGGDWQSQGLIIPLLADVWGEMATESFSSTVSLAWDENHLYLLAEVIDDTLYQDNTGPLWRNDGMEIFLSERKGSRNIVQYLLAAALTDAFPETKTEKNNLGTSERFLSDPELLIASKVNDNGYTIELGIPFGSVGMSPVMGDTIAFNFYIGDSDSPTRHSKYSWHYNDNTYMNHDAMYQVVLSEAGRHHHVLTRANLTDTTRYNIQLFSQIPYQGDVRLMQNEEVFSASSFELQNGIYQADFGFDAAEVTDLSQPLQVVFGETVVTAIDWLDIPRQYIDIPAPRRFANEILLFEKEDARNFPPKGATLFVGSSSIRLWRTLPEDIPGLEIINRGFGGSQTDDVLYYYNRIVAPYHPKNIVYFTGTNDLASGRTPEETVANVEEFIVRSNARFPDVKIYILSNTIAVSRKHLHERYHQANSLLVQMLDKYDNAVYVDVTTPGLTADGRPRPEIYTADSLHLNRIGYEMWGDVLRPMLTGK